MSLCLSLTRTDPQVVMSVSLTERDSPVLMSLSDRDRSSGLGVSVCDRNGSLGLDVSLCFVWKFSCITFHSLIHAYMYINNTCNLTSTHQ